MALEKILHLIPLLTWCSEIGLDILQLLPINDCGLDSSPYSALSAMALNPIYLGLTDLPYVSEDISLQMHLRDLQKLSKSQRIDYPFVYKGKNLFLHHYYQRHALKITKERSYKDFKEKNSFWLDVYTVFKALKIFHHWQSWETWPSDEQNPSENFFHTLSKPVREEAEFHCFLQYLCFSQFEQVKEHAKAKNIFLKGDLPILISKESADVWYNRDLFILELSAGAPPDMYSSIGQNWGFPLYNWKVLVRKHYQWWIERLSVASKLYQLYRLDHIVGFFRIWAIPKAKSAKEGHFIPQEENLWLPQGESLMHMMLANSDMLPIGEDLRSCPPTVRLSLQKFGICGTKVMRWERHWDTDKSFIGSNEYPFASMTTISTHDSETLQQWWEGNSEEAQLFASTIGIKFSSKLTQDLRFAILYASHHSQSAFHINLLQEYLALFQENDLAKSK